MNDDIGLAVLDVGSQSF